MQGTELPQDPFMLLSTINMLLRDEYPSIDELCAAMDIKKEWLQETLGAAGFEYSEEQNKFW